MSRAELTPKNATFNTSREGIRSLIERIDKGSLDLNPPYQRSAVWSKQKKQLFVDTILMNIPCPTIILIANSTGHECVDGKQRLTAIVEFFRGSFPVKFSRKAIDKLPVHCYGNEYTNEKNTAKKEEMKNKILGPNFARTKTDNYLYSELPVCLQLAFTQYGIPVTTMLGEWPENTVTELFSRIQNGAQLTTGQLIESHTSSKIVQTAKKYEERIRKELDYFLKTTTATERSKRNTTLLFSFLLLMVTRYPKLTKTDYMEWIESGKADMYLEETPGVFDYIIHFFEELRKILDVQRRVDGQFNALTLKTMFFAKNIMEDTEYRRFLGYYNDINTKKPQERRRKTGKLGMMPQIEMFRKWEEENKEKGGKMDVTP